MSQGGFIIRLIDISLIILFGFISISDLRVQTQIKLPAPVERFSAEDDVHPIIVRIEPEASYQVIENKIARPIASFDELETLLSSRSRKLSESSKQVVVLIQPDEASGVQATVDVIDLCRKYELMRNIAFDYASINL